MMNFLIEEENKIKTCAFTGHRELGANFDEKKLKLNIELLIKKGVKIFYNGGAVGFDLTAAKIVLKLKKKHDIKLIICVPFYGQEKNFSSAQKELYNKILKEADEVVVLSDNYYKGCFLRRNDYMIENADYLIAYLTKEVGGTAYTVKKFRAKKGDNVILIN